MVLNVEAASEYLHPHPRATKTLCKMANTLLQSPVGGNAHEIDLEVLGNCKFHEDPW